MTTLTPPSTLISEVSIKADADVVWRALRDPAEIRSWFGWQYDGLTDEIAEIFLDGAEESAADRRLRWEHGDEFVVEPDGDFTTVKAIRNGEFDPADWAEIDDGWISFLQQLRLALETHLGEERRTIHLGPTNQSDALDQLLSSTPGTQVDLKPATGVEAAGELQFCDGRQACVRVDSYGEGLVVLSPAHVIVTTYGMSDEDFAAVAAEWQAAFRSD